MHLSELEVEHLRCLQRADLEFHPGVNLIQGANGAGKTSLLEAIFLLARGRSFRTRHTERLISGGAERLQVLGRLADASAGTLGYAYSRDGGAEVRIDRRSPRSLVELSAAFPAQVLDPGIHRLVEEGPSHRRKWLDWGVFHVEPLFTSLWADYSQVLKQRNAALKLAHDPSPWDHELATIGERLSAARRSTLDALLPFWQETVTAILSIEVGLSYFQGWSQERSLAENLNRYQVTDRERGTTAWGPHRFDVLLTAGKGQARDFLSRGQQKLLGSAMALSMAKLVASCSGHSPVLLLDDPAAELDEERTQSLLGQIHALNGQLFLTSLHSNQSLAATPDRVFHVEQGRVLPV